MVHDSSRQLFHCDYDHCKKVYSSKVSFNVHIALHKVEDGSLECAMCHKLYDNPQSLTLHIKVHSGSYTSKGLMEKKFKCSSCDKRFFASKDRDRHMLTHTKEKNFECNICFMKFSRSDHLKRHLLKIHPNGQKTVKQPRRKTMKADQLPDLTASELTRSIQQLLAETNMTMDGSAVVPLTTNGELAAAVQLTPMVSGSTGHRQINQSDPLNFTTGSVSNLRSGINSFLNNIQSNSSSQGTAGKQHSSTWQSSTSGEGAMRYVISTDALASGDGNTLSRYYITGETVRSPPSDGPMTAYLLPTDTSQNTTVNIDSIPRHSSLMMDSNHALPSDSLSNDFTADGMKVLTGLTPIFLNPDGTATDNDLIPIVYQSNQS